MIDPRIYLEQLRDSIAASGLDTARTLDVQARHLQRTAGLQTKEPLPVEDTAVMLRRVRHAIARGQLDKELVSRDARFALRSFAAFTPAEVSALLQWYPKGWTIFTDALLGARTSTGNPPGWHEWCALVREAPENIELMHGELTASLLLEDPVASARAVARHFRRTTTLAGLESAICRRGMLRSAWPYTALVVAAWVEQHPAEWSSIWSEVASEPLYEAWLVPRDRAGRSRFGKRRAELPGSAGEDIGAQAIFAVCALRQVSDTASDAQVHDTLASIWLQKDAFDDPRTFADPRRPPPKNVGWQRVQALAPTEYETFVERLIAADVELFFNQVEFAPDRRAFWLNYRRQIVRTAFCFRESTRKLLESRLAESPALEGVRRARHLHSTAGQLDAFVLFFRSVVVVEFSAVNNSAFFYEPTEFEKDFPRTGDVLMRHLKNRNSVGGLKMVHSPAPGWESKFRQELKMNWDTK